MTRLCTLADAEAVARRAAREIAQHLGRAREERGVAHLALSGGTTPARAYELLAQELEDWQHVEVWFADERCVEPEHEQSNYRMARETLLGRIPIRSEQIHRMEGELGPERGAERYARALRARVAPGVPALDVVVLGIGPDGHIASLFPDSPALAAAEEAATLRRTTPQAENAICLGVRDSPKPPPERITLSLAVLRAARRCVLLAAGLGKKDAVNAALAEPSPTVPASLLSRERLTIILDDAASPPPPVT